MFATKKLLHIGKVSRTRVDFHVETKNIRKEYPPVNAGLRRSMCNSKNTPHTHTRSHLTTGVTAGPTIYCFIIKKWFSNTDIPHGLPIIPSSLKLKSYLRSASAQAQAPAPAPSTSLTRLVQKLFLFSIHKNKSTHFFY